MTTYDRKIAAILKAADTPKLSAILACDASEIAGFPVHTSSITGAFLSGYLAKDDGLYWNPELCSRGGGQIRRPKSYTPVCPNVE